mmetsp:Transcript_29818/g.88560  ORF Transcript_29818/g.88560 Transcript_29818/m.88560 type:complete len:217 (+) Transcript_29818:868-1518(+)
MQHQPQLSQDRRGVDHSDEPRGAHHAQDRDRGWVAPIEQVQNVAEDVGPGDDYVDPVHGVPEVFPSGGANPAEQLRHEHHEEDPVGGVDPAVTLALSTLVCFVHHEAQVQHDERDHDGVKPSRSGVRLRPPPLVVLQPLGCECLLHCEFRSLEGLLFRKARGRPQQLLHGVRAVRGVLLGHGGGRARAGLALRRSIRDVLLIDLVVRHLAPLLRHA